MSATTSFRHSDAMMDFLSETATDWRISRGACAHWLCVIGATGFSPEFVPTLAAIARLRGGENAFELTCREARTAFERAAAAGHPSMIVEGADPRAIEFANLKITLELRLKQITAQAKSSRLRPLESTGSG